MLGGLGYSSCRILYIVVNSKGDWEEGGTVNCMTQKKGAEKAEPAGILVRK